MDLLKRENTIVWIILYIITFGFSNTLLAHQMKLLKKGEWYTKALYIVPLMFLSFGTALISPIAPFLILLFIFNYQTTILIANKLNLPGYEYYNSPYIIIGLGLIPVIGWSIIISLFIFLNIYIIKKISNGECEKFIEN